MNQEAVYPRALVCWKLAFVHGGKTIHFLCSALLLTLASAGLAFAWFCCWLDRFKSSRQPTSWLIRPQARKAEVHSMAAPEPFPVRHNERFAAAAPRTIDSLIGSKGLRVQ